MNGILIINKPKGYTSHDIVAKVKKIYKVKVGHTGTLDPNATGVLPLLLGEATKLSYYLTNHDKEYDVTLKLGIKTDTADSEGEIVQKEELDNIFVQERFKQEYISKILNNFIGKQKQIPPMYSAIKVKGKKLYEYARKGEIVNIKPREIEIYEMILKNIDIEQKEIEFKVKCSKGTYIRSLCEDIANRLDTIGYMKELNRTMVGEFCIENSVTIEELEKGDEQLDTLKEQVISIEDFFKTYKQENIKDNKIELYSEEIKKFINGVQLERKLQEGLYRIYYPKYQFIGIGMVKNNLLKREIIVENM